ncbi:MAG: DUF3536 domain-containing protein [Gemmataceae bacterium]
MPHPRYVCVHGHFYQPPRESPWLEAVERQESAEPYHDWNQRIAAECYAPNARSRVLDADGRIVRIVNNYAHMSFNFGPTLLSWLDQHDPATYAAILDADRQSRERFSGHGNALAQVYNHAIMPLCNERDKRTQVRWGLADFERRFGRRAEGMWLAETATDLATLDVLADAGIRFTILSPHQAKRFRLMGGTGNDWVDVAGGKIDPTRPYLCKLPSNRAIVLFFYDAPVSQAVAFEGLLKSGERFAARLLGGLNDTRDWPQLLHIATDGETYGHHSAHGDMALAYALAAIDADADVALTNYGEYLDRHPPVAEAELHDVSSWSCAHGVGRWSTDCGCRMRGDWHQKWRGPLRAALDWLRDEAAALYESGAGRLFADPWAARDDAIDLVLDRRPATAAAFFDRHCGRSLVAAEEVTARRWLELQRNCLLMYTSCGWFFDEVSGLEGTQILKYAARVIQLAEGLAGRSLEGEFLTKLALAPSNIPMLKDARRAYERYVKPSCVDLAKVAAHFAVSSLFENYPQSSRLDAYTAVSDDVRNSTVNQARLTTGRATVTSEVTGESATFAFAAVHFGETNLSGGVRPFAADENARRKSLEDAFQRYDVPEVVRLLDREYDAAAYSLRSLFHDEQRKILEQVLEPTEAAMEALLRQVVETNGPAMRFLAALDRPGLPAFRTAATFILNRDLRRALAADEPDPEQVGRLAEAVRTFGVPLDQGGVAFALRGCAERLLARIVANPNDIATLDLADALLARAAGLEVPTDCWAAQNAFYDLLQTEYPARQASGDAEWCAAFASLGERLGVRVNPS